MTARRNDPSYKPKSIQQLLELDRTLLAKLTPLLPRYFGRLPHAPFRTAPLPPSLRSTAGMYVRPSRTNPVGTFYFPSYYLDKVTMFARAPLIYHEYAHHIQRGLIVEDQTLLPFFRFSSNVTYTEGWGEYFRGMCNELGVYSDDDRLGILANSLFKSVQMVVDTGIGYYNWSFERARDFMHEYLSLADTEIDIEILRYATVPGYSPAYRLGNLQFQDVRQRVESALGDRFDIRDFHDTVIAIGSMPFEALRARMDRYVARRKAG